MATINAQHYLGPHKWQALNKQRQAEREFVKFTGGLALLEKRLIFGF
jgi:hypothetical protein